MVLLISWCINETFIEIFNHNKTGGETTAYIVICNITRKRFSL